SDCSWRSHVARAGAQHKAGTGGAATQSRHRRCRNTKPAPVVPQQGVPTMKRPLTCTAALALLIGLTAPMTASAQANRQQQQVSREQALERANLSRTSELIGMTVFARGGAELGEVHD